MRGHLRAEARVWLSAGSLGVTLMTLAALLLAFQAPAAFDLASPGVALEGVHAPERSNARVFRWSDGRARVRFAGVGAAAYRLSLALSGPRPEGLTPPVARVSVNGVPLGTLQTTRALQAHVFELAPQLIGPGGDAEIEIASETFVPPNDLRPLGIALFEARLERADGSTLPAPLTTLACLLAVLAVFQLMPAARIGAVAALLLIALGVASIALARVWAAGAAPLAAVAACTLTAGARIRRFAAWRETLVALATGLSGLNFTAECLQLLRTSRFTDVLSMFEAAQKLAAGLDPYDYAVVRDNPLYAHSYVYPPTFAQFLMLFLPFGIEGGIRIWAALNMALYGVVVWGLLRAFQLRWRSAGMYAFLLVAFNYRPALDTLSGGQLDVLILALLLGALSAARRGGWLRAGALVATAGITKLHPLFIGLFFLPRARWRGLAGLAVSGIALVAVSALFASPELYARYVTVVLPGRGGGGTGNAENQSLSGFFYRAHGVLWYDPATPEQARSIQVWTAGASAALALVTLGTWPLSGRRRAAELQFATLIILMLLILPTSWMHYEVQALLPLAAVLSYALAGRAPVALGLWAAASLLAACANQEIFRGGEFDAMPLLLLQSYKLYGMLLCWGLLIWMQVRKDEDAAGHGDGADRQRV